MALFSLLDLSHAFGGAPILDHVNFQVDPGERVCLVGRNGAGKSTLMKLIAGDMQPDGGQIFRQPGAHFARLVQEVPQDLAGTVHDVVASGVRRDVGHEEDWEIDVRVEDLISRLQLDPLAEVSTLSGGLKRRVLLGRAIASKPDLLLLDEPTNHLDIESILWLEDFLLGEKIGLFFVTHDRAFLQKLATRIVELDRGVLTNWACPYDVFLVRRQERLEAEERQRAAADKKLAQEEEWIRRGVRAQRKRAGARIAALHALRAERKARRERAGSATIRVSVAEESGVKVIEAENLTFAYPGADTPIVRGFSGVITRGDKIGLIGPNGAGKTTFLKLLLGQLQPTSGTLKHGTRLEVVYLDQLRAQIDDDKTVADNVSDGNSHVTVQGRSRHVISYLQDFLFEPSRSRTPARVLSGGERNRLLLARLFTKPANVLVLDEPTNDLDAETLELLENLLVEFEGTVLVVSHDRRFLDEVVTSTYVFDGRGGIEEYVGGYSDWVAEKAKQAKAAAAAAPKAEARAADGSVAGATASAPAKKSSSRKLTNKEQRELAELPARIEKLETEQAELVAKLSDPKFFKSDPAAVRAAEARLREIEAEHAAAFARWEELESVNAG
jgi:ATPase components of ABC transporters with duplicated ATPase domains